MEKKRKYVYLICYEQYEAYARFPTRGIVEMIFPEKITRIEQIREAQIRLKDLLVGDMYYSIFNYKLLRIEEDSESSEN